jgi:hypothetical protein
MDGNRFDTIARRLASVTSRRHVLAGLGVATAGSLVGRAAVAAPSPVAQCMKTCNRDAKTDRAECKSLKSKAKKGCLKTVKQARADCRAECRTDDGGV